MDLNGCSKRDEFVENIPVNNLQSNREGMTLVWFDPILKEKNIFQLTTRLRSLIDYILFYTERSLYLDYLRSAQERNDSVIVILTNTESLDETHDCQQVRAILLLVLNDDENEKMKTFQTTYKKVLPIANDHTSIYNRLQQVIADVEHQLGQDMTNTFNVYNPKERCLKDLNNDWASFLWGYIFKVLIKAMPHSLEDHQQMLDEYRSYYTGNSRQLSIIDEFERNYNSDHAIQWYTKSCFLFRVLNQVLRTKNFNALYTFRSVIVDLSANLESSDVNKNIKRVYRGAQISKDEIENYTVGTLVTCNAFLSTSRNLQVAQRFIGLDSITGKSPSQSREEQMQYVFFEIDISEDRSSDLIWADVSSQSVFPDEEEILFDFGTTFEIANINYDCKHYFWYIQMRSSTEVAHRKREYEKHVREQMKETSPTLLFGILLFDMGEYEQSSKYLQHLLDQMSNDYEDRANVFYSIARIYRFTSRYEKALEYLFCAERFLRARLPQSNYDLARTLSGMATVYYEMHDYERELIYYQESMTIFQQILPSNHIEIARSFNRLGFAYTNQQNYAKALENLNKSLAIYNTILPNDHHNTGQVLYNIGVVYQASENIDQSLQYYRRALELREKSLPSYHPSIAQSCLAISTIHKKQHQYDLASSFARRALSIYEEKLPQGHKSINDAQEIIQSIQNELTF